MYNDNWFTITLVLYELRLW